MEYDIEYALLQRKYRKINSLKKDIFPKEWYFIKEYDLKKKILKECIDNNYLIYNSSHYREFRIKALNS